MSGNGYTKKGWRVTFDTEACSLCEMCVNHCANHALLARREDLELEILFDHRQCDGCLGQAFCQEHCPEDAVTVTRAPMDELPDEPVSLITGELAQCEKCGNPFMPERKLAKLLDQRKIAPKPVQRICPDCRRGQLMDSYMNILNQG